MRELSTTSRPRPDDDDEIEILEVVGVDPDAPPVAADAGDEAETVAEVVLDFDADGAVGEAPAISEDRERLLRLSAEFDNFRKRVEREREATERHATANLVQRLLQVLDNFERALSTGVDEVDANFREGVVLIFRQLLDELRREGLAAVDSVGEPFNPEVHEAVATTYEPGLPENAIVEEFQRGYLLHERLLRPALVRVNVEPGGNGGGDRGDG